MSEKILIIHKSSNGELFLVVTRQAKADTGRAVVQVHGFLIDSSEE